MSPTFKVPDLTSKVITEPLPLSTFDSTTTPLAFIVAYATINANGVVVESKVERGKGSVITLLVKSGTLKVGDIIVVGSESGKVRALLNDTGKRINNAGLHYLFFYQYR